MENSWKFAQEWTLVPFGEYHWEIGKVFSIQCTRNNETLVLISFPFDQVYLEILVKMKIQLRNNRESKRASFPNGNIKPLDYLGFGNVLSVYVCVYACVYLCVCEYVWESFDSHFPLLNQDLLSPSVLWHSRFRKISDMAAFLRRPNDLFLSDFFFSYQN